MAGDIFKWGKFDFRFLVVYLIFYIPQFYQKNRRYSEAYYTYFHEGAELEHKSDRIGQYRAHH